MDDFYVGIAIRNASLWSDDELASRFHGYAVRLRRCTGLVLRCHACKREIQPGKSGRVRVEAITVLGTMDCVWGPVPVHEACRLNLETPFDSHLGVNLVATHGWVRIHAAPDELPSVAPRFRVDRWQQ